MEGRPVPSAWDELQRTAQAVRAEPVVSVESRRALAGRDRPSFPHDRRRARRVRPRSPPPRRARTSPARTAAPTRRCSRSPTATGPATAFTHWCRAARSRSIGENARYDCNGIEVNGRSDDMIQRNYFAHPILGCGQLVFSMMSAFGVHYKSAGENIGWVSGEGSATAAADYINGAFMNSPDHRSNILDGQLHRDGRRIRRERAGRDLDRRLPRAAERLDVQRGVRPGRAASARHRSKTPKPGPSGGHNSPAPRAACRGSGGCHSGPPADSDVDAVRRAGRQPSPEPPRPADHPVRRPAPQQHRIRPRSFSDALVHFPAQRAMTLTQLGTADPPSGDVTGNIVVASGLHKVYRVSRPPREAIRDISLTVTAGEFIAIMGPSGCGKSTLLHMLGGLEPPDQGTVESPGHRHVRARRRGALGVPPRSHRRRLPVLQPPPDADRGRERRAAAAPPQRGACPAPPETLAAGDRRSGRRAHGAAQPPWPAGTRPRGDLRRRAAASRACPRAGGVTVTAARRRADRQPRLDERPRGDGAPDPAVPPGAPDRGPRDPRRSCRRVRRPRPDHA